MRYAPFCVLSAVVALKLSAESLVPLPPALTVVLDFKQAQSSRVIEEMKRSTEEILAGSGVHLDWRLRAEVGSESFPELVLVTFKGKCLVDSRTDETFIPGPLASTHVTEGQVQPFADVFCDNVASLTRAAIAAGAFGNADPLMGRALAKVLAHELMHMITKSEAHGTSGIGKAALTGRQLVDHDTALEADDLDRIREESSDRR
jgi:hypothetical protein